MAATALIAQAANPVGKAVAVRLAQQGYDVAVGFDSRADEADEIVDLVEQAGQQAVRVPGRLGDPIVASKLVDRTSKQLGVPERVVVGPRQDAIGVESAREEAKPTARLSPSHVDAVLAADLKGPLAVLDGARRALDEGDEVPFVAIACAHRLRAGPNGAAARAALAALEDSLLSVSRAGDPVVASLVVPGPVAETQSLSEDAQETAQAAERELTDASEVADVVVHALSGPRGIAGTRFEIGASGRGSPVGDETPHSEPGALGRPGIEQRVEGPPDDHIDDEP